MENFWPEFLEVTALQIFGLISPGPNFALVVRNSLVLSRKNAMYTVFGLTLATIIQLLAVVLGLGVLACKYPHALNIIKILGASFLGYLGLSAWGLKFPSSKKTPTPDTPLVAGQSLQESARTAFITSILNPMSLMFYLSLYSTTVSEATPLSIRMFYLFTMVATFALWFAIVGMFFSNKRVQQKFMSAKTLIDRITGTVLIFFAVRMLLAEL